MTARSVTLRNAEAGDLDLSLARFSGGLNLLNFKCRALTSSFGFFTPRIHDPGTPVPN